MASNGPVEPAPDVEVTSISNGNSHSAAVLSEWHACDLRCSLLMFLRMLACPTKAEIVPVCRQWDGAYMGSWRRRSAGCAAYLPPPRPARGRPCLALNGQPGPLHPRLDTTALLP